MSWIRRSVALAAGATAGLGIGGLAAYINLWIVENSGVNCPNGSIACTMPGIVVAVSVVGLVAAVLGATRER